MSISSAVKSILLTCCVLFGSLNVMAAYTTECNDLGRLKLPNSEIVFARVETAKTYNPGPTKLPGPPLTDLPSFCRVAVRLTPTADSTINFELWMPTSGWNGKFMGVGNGGWSGEIWYPFMGMALRSGYATASTDTGHEGSVDDASFALGHPEKLVDFAYRAIHEMTVQSKAILTTFYSAKAKHSYWFGCSSGGRQGLKEAQTFPQDYDGIISGAPANYFSHLSASGVWVWQANHDGTTQVLSQSKLEVLHKAALKVCGVRAQTDNGVIESPLSCRFDPAAVRCTGSDTAQCLTAAEVEAANKIYAGPSNPRTHKRIFPGLEPGSELKWLSFGEGPEPQIVTSYFRYVVFKDPSWKPEQLNYDSDIALADRLDNGLIDATDPDLKRFMDHGGKLILYHGWADEQIAPRNTIDYYEKVVRADRAGAATSVRLFMAPGQSHCGGLTGPSSFDVTKALEAWVEHGKAPELISAGTSNAEGGSTQTRPLCAHPKIATDKGADSKDGAATFVCKD